MYPSQYRTVKRICNSSEEIGMFDFGKSCDCRPEYPCLWLSKVKLKMPQSLSSVIIVCQCVRRQQDMKMSVITDRNFYVRGSHSGKGDDVVPLDCDAVQTRR